jgi:hypothetical protein
MKVKKRQKHAHIKTQNRSQNQTSENKSQHHMQNFKKHKLKKREKVENIYLILFVIIE